jgi:hypothetical protein
MEYMMPPILKGNCSEEYSKVLSDPKRGGDYLVNCILENLTEPTKAEMAIVSVIMGLLPFAIQLIGPKVPDLSALALRRPFLALLLAIGSPCAALEHDRTGLEPLLRVENERPLWPDFLLRPPLWVKAIITIFEFAVVGLAAINSTYLGYILTFRTICLVSTITGTFGGTPEAFAPLLWVFLSIPMYAAGACALALCNSRATQTESEHEKRSFLKRVANKTRTWLKHELTPCAFTATADVTTLPRKGLSTRTRYILLILHWLIRAGVWIDVIYGVIVFSSIMFLSLFNALEVIGKFLGGSVVCRVILAFEIYGLQVVARMEQRNENGKIENEDTTEAPVPQLTAWSTA